MKKVITICVALCIAGAVYGQDSVTFIPATGELLPRTTWQNNKTAINAVIDHPITLNLDGTVAAPVNFWEANAEAINAVVKVSSVPKPTKKIFTITVPYPGFNVTDFSLKAMREGENGSAEMAWWYYSPDPVRDYFKGQIYTTRPLVYFTTTDVPEDGRKRHRQGDTSIAEQTQGEVVWSFTIEIPYDEAPVDCYWVYNLMTPNAGLSSNGKTIWVQIVPQDIFEIIEKPETPEESIEPETPDE